MNSDKNYEQCLEKLSWVVEQLQVEVTRIQLSNIAKLIVQTMTGPWRYFHSTEHIFEVGGSEDAIEMLAALFHDIVYVQIDGSINFNLTYYLAPFIIEEKGQLYIRERDDCQSDPIFKIVTAIFCFSPGQLLSPFGGQNEFLSAVVAAKVLDSFMSPSLIVQVTACIEATIPFRSPSESTLGVSEILYQRLQSVNESYNIKLTDAEIIQTVKRSVRLANRDVHSFADESAAVFLDSTWSLLPETNHNLHKAGSYTVNDYRKAIQKMASFMNFLNPDLVFRQFQGEPDDKLYQSMVKQARKNIETARLYLESKLVAIAILEALSLCIGSDVSVTMMMGELPSSKVSIGRLGDFFPPIVKPYKPETEIEKEVLDLLAIGRNKSSTYDLKDSPLTTFVVKCIGFKEVRRLIERSQAFFQGSISSEEFLCDCHTDLTQIISKGVIKLLENRKVALRRLL